VSTLDLPASHLVARASPVLRFRLAVYYWPAKNDPVPSRLARWLVDSVHGNSMFSTAVFW
jgi:hypothetical protein